MRLLILPNSFEADTIKMTKLLFAASIIHLKDNCNMIFLSDNQINTIALIELA
jgi:hypothetical protein